MGLAEFELKVDELVAVNGGTSEGAPEGIQDTYTKYVEHIVKAGDTVKSLSDFYHVSWVKIKKANGKKIKDFDHLTEGAVLLIPLD